MITVNQLAISISTQQI